MTATPLEESVRQSDFIFNGTVQQLGGTTLATLEATDRTAIVRVDEGGARTCRLCWPSRPGDHA